MKKITFVVLIFLLFGCRNEADKKIVYELQDKCGQSAVLWANKHSEIQDYETHYNQHVNKCFILATLQPIFSSDMSIHHYMLFDVNENREYGHITVRSYQNGSVDSYQSNIQGKYYSDNQAKGRWDSFVKEIMEQ